MEYPKNGDLAGGFARAYYFGNSAHLAEGGEAPRQCSVHDSMRELDFALFQWMAAGYEPNTWLLALARISSVGGSWISAGLMGWAVWRWPSQRGLISTTLVACGAAALLAHFIAASLNLPRPFVVGLSPAYIVHGARGSLPSAHATVMFTIAWMFILRPQLRFTGLALFGVAVITGWARIYVGVHFPMDIAVGLLIGLVLAGVFHGLWGVCQNGPVPITVGRLVRRLASAHKDSA